MDLAAAASARQRTAAARLQAVITTAATDEATRSAWCREQGLYPAERRLGSRTSLRVWASRVQPVPWKRGGTVGA